MFQCSATNGKLPSGSKFEKVSIDNLVKNDKSGKRFGVNKFKESLIDGGLSWYIVRLQCHLIFVRVELHYVGVSLVNPSIIIYVL